MLLQTSDKSFIVPFFYKIHEGRPLRLIPAACPSPMRKPAKWRASRVKMGEEERESVGLGAPEAFFHAESGLYRLRFASCWKMILIGGADCSLTCGWGSFWN
jgi:hypothetical protein